MHSCSCTWRAIIKQTNFLFNKFSPTTMRAQHYNTGVITCCNFALLFTRQKNHFLPPLAVDMAIYSFSLRILLLPPYACVLENDFYFTPQLC